MKYDDQALEKQEPERDFSPLFKNLKLLFIAIGAIIAIIYILAANFSKIGT